MQSLLDRQTALAVAINTYIEDRASVPASITVLKNANYLPLAYDEHNPYDKDALTFTITHNQIRIDSNVETNARRTADLLYYINTNKNRELDRRSVQEGGKLISYYALSAKAATNLNLSSLLSYAYFAGDVNPTTYAAVNDGTLWFSSTYDEERYKLYYYASGWKSLERGNKNFTAAGTFENQRAIPLIKSSWKFTTVDVNTVQKSITCFINGTTYNPYKDRCEAYTSNACDSLIFRTTTGYCDLGDNSACTYNGGAFDTDKKLCKKGSTYTAKLKYCHLTWSIQTTIFDANGFSYDTNDIIASSGGNDWIRILDIIAYPPTDNTIVYVGNSRDRTTKYPSPYEFANVINYNYSVDKMCTVYTDKGDIIPSFSMIPGVLSNENNVYSCDAGGTLSGTTCDSTEYYSPDCSVYGSGYAHDGYGRCAKTPTCAAKTMPVSPYYATPYYDNNGVCYSDVGLYCKTYGVPYDGLYTCFNYQFGCDDSSYNLRTDTDICEKFSFTCNIGKRYGLDQSPTNNNATDLYDRISNKDAKANTYVTTLISNDVTINDNGGAMCTALEYNTFTQSTFASDYTIGGEIKSGF